MCTEKGLKYRYTKNVNTGYIWEEEGTGVRKNSF